MVVCYFLQVFKDPDLRERHLGDLQGVVYNDIAKVNPVAYKIFVSTQKDLEIPVHDFSFFLCWQFMNLLISLYLFPFPYVCPESNLEVLEPSNLCDSFIQN